MWRCYSKNVERTLLLHSLLIFLLLGESVSDAQPFTCSVGSGGACPVAFCPGDEVTYTCDVGTVMGTTDWILPNGTCDTDPPSTISLAQSSACSTSGGMCGPFSAANDGKDGTNCLVSSLTVTASTDLNNTLIQCNNVDLMSNPTEVDSTVLTIAVPPPPPTGVSVASCTGDSVTLVWEEPTDTDSPVTSYELLASPTVENCNSKCNTTTAQYTFIGLLLDRSYDLSVQGVNCGSQVGTASQYTTIYSVLEDSDVGIVLCLTFDGTNLTDIGISWSNVNFYVGNTSCGILDYYTVSYNSSGINVSKSIDCSGECSDDLTITEDDIGATYQVSVAALGKILDTEVIKYTNNFLLVEFYATSPPVMATCLFLSGFTGDALCRVDFTGPDGFTYTSVSTERGSAGESEAVELTLNGAALLPSTIYSYLATLEDPSDESSCVRITGQFTTGEYSIDCTLDSLGATVSSDSSECGEGEMAGDIPNGTLCYTTGLTPGSTATYTCDKGYELSGNSSAVLECLPNGAWNETFPNCTKTPTDPVAPTDKGGSNTGAIVGGVVGGLLGGLAVAGGVGGGVAFFIVFIKKRKPSDSSKGGGDGGHKDPETGQEQVKTRHQDQQHLQKQQEPVAIEMTGYVHVRTCVCAEYELTGGHRPFPVHFSNQAGHNANGHAFKFIQA